MLFSCSFRYQNLLHNFETMNTSNLDDESNHENVCPDDLVRKVLQAIPNEKETEPIYQADDSSETGRTGDLDMDETKTAKQEKEIKHTITKEAFEIFCNRSIQENVPFISSSKMDH